MHIEPKYYYIYVSVGGFFDHSFYTIHEIIQFSPIKLISVRKKNMLKCYRHFCISQQKCNHELGIATQAD